MKRILIVEDDEAIVYSLTELLQEEGFAADAVRSLREMNKTNIGEYGLILLDLGLPDGEGWELLSRQPFSDRNVEPIATAEWAVRAEMPIIILTARDSEADIMKGLDMGADDYVTKPFRTGVLLARIRAVLRRHRRVREAEADAGGDVLFCGTLRLDRAAARVTDAERELVLTAGEFRLLAYLMENRGRTLTRNALLAHLWDNDGEFVNDNTLTVTIKRLREKLGAESGRMLQTVRGIGYRMEAPSGDLL